MFYIFFCVLLVLLIIFLIIYLPKNSNSANDQLDETQKKSVENNLILIDRMENDLILIDQNMKEKKNFSNKFTKKK